MVMQMKDRLENYVHMVRKDEGMKNSSQLEQSQNPEYYSHNQI